MSANLVRKLIVKYKLSINQLTVQSLLELLPKGKD